MTDTTAAPVRRYGWKPDPPDRRDQRLFGAHRTLPYAYLTDRGLASDFWAITEVVTS